MEKVDILYDRMDHIIALSAGHCQTFLTVSPSNILKIRYSEYVKSQLHLNIVNQLFDRPVELYKQAYDYLCGNKVYHKAAGEVLTYFYKDIINFLYYNKYNVKVELITDINSDGKKYFCDYQKYKDSLTDLANRTFSDFHEILEYVQENKSISKVCDYVTRIENIPERIDSFTAIAILTKYKPGRYIEWEVPNGD